MLGPSIRDVIRRGHGCNLFFSFEKGRSSRRCACPDVPVSRCPPEVPSRLTEGHSSHVGRFALTAAHNAGQSVSPLLRTHTCARLRMSILGSSGQETQLRCVLWRLCDRARLHKRPNARVPDGTTPHSAGPGTGIPAPPGPTPSRAAPHECTARTVRTHAQLPCAAHRRARSHIRRGAF